MPPQQMQSANQSMSPPPQQMTPQPTSGENSVTSFMSSIDTSSMGEKTINSLREILAKFQAWISGTPMQPTQTATTGGRRRRARRHKRTMKLH
jgi:hypothetical protein